MKKTKIFKNIALFLLFNIVLVFSIERVAYVLREKEGTNTWDNFKVLEPDSVDVIFIGTSHQFSTINPD